LVEGEISPWTGPVVEAILSLEKIWNRQRQQSDLPPSSYEEEQSCWNFAGECAACTRNERWGLRNNKHWLQIRNYNWLQII